MEKPAFVSGKFDPPDLTGIGKTKTKQYKETQKKNPTHKPTLRTATLKLQLLSCTIVAYNLRVCVIIACLPESKSHQGWCLNISFLRFGVKRNQQLSRSSVFT